MSTTCAEPALPMPCGRCGRREVHLLLGPAGDLGLVGCARCSQLGVALLSRPGGRLTVLSPDGELAATEPEPRHLVVLARIGPVSIWLDEDQVSIEHEHGWMRYTLSSRIVDAHGIFTDALAVIERPPPCSGCGSDDTWWRDSEEGHVALCGAAETLRKRIVEHRCGDRVQLLLEGYGGRVAYCRSCGGTNVYPTVNCDRQPVA